MIDWLYLSCLVRVVRKLICMVNYCHFMKCCSWLLFKDGESKKWFMWIIDFCSLHVELCHWCFCVFEAGFCLNSYVYTQAQKLSNFFKQCTDVQALIKLQAQNLHSLKRIRCSSSIQCPVSFTRVLDHKDDMWKMCTLCVKTIRFASFTYGWNDDADATGWQSVGLAPYAMTILWMIRLWQQTVCLVQRQAARTCQRYSQRQSSTMSVIWHFFINM